MKRIGIIGLGFMGGMHLRNWQVIPGAEVVAVCSRRAPESKAVAGNIGDADVELNLDGIRHYTNATDMYAREELHAVSITLPTHMHREAVLEALEAGVDVLCEKPMALSVEDCSEMVAVAQKTGRQLMIAHCIRFWPAYVWLKETVQSGTHGKIVSGQFDRLCSMPSWNEGSWFSDPQKSGGIALDLHIHDLDFMSYLCGVPLKQVSRNVTNEDRHDGAEVKEIHTVFEYADQLSLGSTASWLMSGSFGFEMSFRAMFEKATVTYSSRVEPGRQLVVYPDQGEVFYPSLDSRDGYFHEIQHFMDLISGRVQHPIINASEAKNSVKLALNSRQSPIF